jgi:hypothetical protein
MIRSIDSSCVSDLAYRPGLSDAFVNVRVEDYMDAGPSATRSAASHSAFLFHSARVDAWCTTTGQWVTPSPS